MCVVCLHEHAHVYLHVYEYKQFQSPLNIIETRGPFLSVIFSCHLVAVTELLGMASGNQTLKRTAIALNCRVIPPAPSFYY